MEIQKIGKIGGLEELAQPGAEKGKGTGAAFSEALKDAIKTVDGLQKESAAAQTSFVRGEQVDLHDVMIKVEQADLAFRTMMEVRNKLVEAYRETMRLGSGG